MREGLLEFSFFVSLRSLLLRIIDLWNVVSVESSSHPLDEGDDILVEFIKTSRVVHSFDAQSQGSNGLAKVAMILLPVKGKLPINNGLIIADFFLEHVVNNHIGVSNKQCVVKPALHIIIPEKRLGGEITTLIEAIHSKFFKRKKVLLLQCLIVRITFSFLFGNLHTPINL